LSFDDIKSMPLICAYTGMILTLEPRHTNTVSLDRIDSHKDYTKANVVFCCKGINFMKHKLSAKDFIDMCLLVAKHYQRGRN
jgi:hypothetical protein